MEFNTTFSWLGQEDLGSGIDVEKGRAELTWDIAVSQDDWVVLGRKKGQYTAQVSYAWRLGLGPAVFCVSREAERVKARESEGKRGKARGREHVQTLSEPKTAHEPI